MSSFLSHLVPLTLGFLGGVLHRMLTIRADQLKIKSKVVPDAVRPLVQEELQKVIPVLAQQIQTWADGAIQRTAQKLEGSSNSNS
ncbi:hypothetical protein [Chthonomonas calidirosea]|nr:hypothetical protein [Chthonomonas calidirosea]